MMRNPQADEPASPAAPQRFEHVTRTCHVCGGEGWRETALNVSGIGNCVPCFTCGGTGFVEFLRPVAA